MNDSFTERMNNKTEVESSFLSSVVDDLTSAEEESNVTTAVHPTGNDVRHDTGSDAYNWPVLLLFFIVVMAIGGNVLVCLAVRYEIKLRNMFNYFLVSLALSDMLSAIFVMPLSIVKALIVADGGLPMPKLLCVTWYSVDVFFTSSTICHLCMISIDRFMALKYPLKYGGHAKDKRHMILKISVVWVMSFCIAGPLFVLSMLDKKITVHYKGCGPETLAFVISATVVSFYLPLLIMTVMYALTVDALRQQLREQRRMTVTQSRCTSVESFDRGSGRTDTAAAAASSASNPTNDSRSFVPFISASATDVQTTSCSALDDTSRPLPPSTRSNHPRSLSSIGRQRIQVFKFQHKNHLNEYRRRGTMKAPDRGRRAVRVLGYLFAVFVVFYLPFFAVYFINGTCARCQAFISGQMITAFEWVQYSGSMLNPIVYHIFNPDFRRAFHKILRCRSEKTRRTN